MRDSGLTARARREEQTARNLRGLDLEREGLVDAAMALYEQNLAEGFEGDWPYSRLVTVYSARGRWDEVVRVLERGLDVLRTSRVRSASDRRALKKVYETRLKDARRRLASSGAASE
jgi:hypothetical protein